MKIVIWGYPLHSHTHSYIHDAFYKAFKYLGHDVYWFDNVNHPSPDSFDYKNCIFWSEGFADSLIPLEKSSIYFIHVCPNPAKYINFGVKKFIDVRYNHLWHSDHVYNYILDKSEVEKLGPGCYFQSRESSPIRVKNDYYDYDCSDYDKLYITWATNLLPFEFSESNIFLEREPAIYFCGNLSKLGRCENFSKFKPFITECESNGIKFIHNDPFTNPLSDERVRELSIKSILGLDIRGPEHIKNGYVPCRVFKSISYGHMGMTNSSEVYKELDGNCIYESDTAKLFHTAMANRLKFSDIKSSMSYVKENHTYINRINSILSVL